RLRARDRAEDLRGDRVPRFAQPRLAAVRARRVLRERSPARLRVLRQARRLRRRRGALVTTVGSIMAIDPGKASGVVYWHRDTPTRLVDPCETDFQDVGDRIEAFCINGGDLIVIEDFKITPRTLRV